MDQTGGQRKFMYDLVYKWTPLGLVVYLFIVCTAMLSVSGSFSHAEVIGFCVTAGLLIAFFAICHLILYCTRIKDQMDLEKSQGHNSTTSLSSHRGASRPAGRDPQLSMGIHGQPAQTIHGKNRQPNQSRPNQLRAGIVHNRPPESRPNANLQARVEDAPDEEAVRPPVRTTNGVPRSTLAIDYLHPHPQHIRSHRSAAPEPLSTERQQAGQPENGESQREYKPYRRPDPKTPSHHPQARDSHNTVEEVSSLHAAGLTPEEAMDSVQRTMGREPWLGSRNPPPSRPRRLDQHSASYQGSSYALGSVPPGQRAGRRLFLGSPSSPENLVRLPNRENEVTDQAGPRNRPVELSAGEVQGYFLLLQEPDLGDLLPRRLLEWKPRFCPTDWSGHVILEKQSTPRDDTGVVVLDNLERKSINIHKAPIAVERMRSQRAQIQHQQRSSKPWRRSADSGYCSVDKPAHSISESQLHTGGRNSVASSVSSGDWRSFVSLERRLSLELEGDEDVMAVSSEIVEKHKPRRRASTWS